MHATHPRDRATREDGGVAVTVGITMTLLVLVSALAIDLGFVRADARRDQTISDLAAVAGASGYRHGYVEVCRRAMTYVYANADELRPPADAAAMDACNAFLPLDGPLTGCDDATTPITATYTEDPYTIAVTSPVADTDPAMTVEGQPVDWTVDGHPCERVKVQVDRGRDFFFAPVASIFQGASTADAVAREMPIGSYREYSSLVVLDRGGCRVLYVSGQGGVKVVNVVGPDPDNPGETITYPGQITLDTRADRSGSIGTNGCTNSSAQAIDLGTDQHAFVRAEGDIKSYGLLERRPVTKIYDPALLTQIASDGGPKLTPRPVPGRMQTRRPIDHQFNCLQIYRATSEAWEPAENIEGCPDWQTRPPYVKELVTALQSGSLSGYNVFPDDLATLGASCTGGPAIVIDGTTMGDHWYINCPATGQGFNPTFVEFDNVEVVVSEHKIDLTSSGVFTIRGPAGRGAILYVRDGNIDKGAQATLTIDNTFVYLQNGTANAGAGSPVLTWRGAVDTGVTDPCSSYLGSGLPPADCFSPLALWSNSSAQHTLGGQAPMNIAGTFFTPNAEPFNLSGQATQTLDEAQFFSYRLEVSGQGVLTLTPNPNTNVETPEWGTGLIR